MILLLYQYFNELTSTLSWLLSPISAGKLDGGNLEQIFVAQYVWALSSTESDQPDDWVKWNGKATWRVALLTHI